MFRSFRARITFFVIAVVLSCVGMIGVISIFSIKRTAEQSSVQFMSLLCDSKYREMNEYMDSVRQSVDILSHYLSADISTVALVEGGVIGAKGTGEMLEGRDWESDQQKVLDEYLREHVKNVQTVFNSVAYNTNNAISYYYRLNPEISNQKPGFLYFKNGTSDFLETTPTDILSFDKDDAERVGWYYKTVERGRPSWHEPYFDKNLNTKMTSYIAPIYKAGTFIGVVGMDLSYDALMEKIHDLDIYATGYAFLTDGVGRIVYHPYLPEGTSLQDVNSELAKLETLSGETSAGSSPLIEYSYNGVEKKAASQTLENGLHLFICAPVSEINAGWQSLIQVLLLTMLLLMLVFATIVTLIMRRVTKPLQRLTEASKQVSEGNYDVDLPSAGDDEIGTLSGAFRELVDNLKTYIDDLNSKAYKDPLTRVKNKTAFDIWCRQINDSLKSEEKDSVEFAVMMFDCNLLKEINDKYGHARGDLYLKKGCDVICKVFTHSPVFRIGGDEFVVILQGEEYRNRRDLMRRFEDACARANAEAKHPWENVNMAMGISLYNSSYDESVENVFKRADKAMYENKRMMKSENR